MTYRRLVATAFLLNGLSMVFLKAISAEHLKAAMPMGLFLMYVVASVPALAHVAAEKRRLEGKSLWIGVMAGVCSALGTAAAGRAASLIPGYIVFPVFSGGTLLLIALTGRVVFKEKIGPYGLAGIIAGAVAIALLSV
ncbi:MAG: hypothetical protein Q7N50_12130 [Armatimonadota bacterium]|nr:hypothetical protein [Armatimonadota bacterium]